MRLFGTDYYKIPPSPTISESAEEANDARDELTMRVSPRTPSNYSPESPVVNPRKRYVDNIHEIKNTTQIIVK